MKLSQYAQQAKKFDRDHTTRSEELLAHALGLGEVGELQGLVKKAVYHGHPLERKKVVLESGDCLWYLCMTGLHFNTDLDTLYTPRQGKREDRTALIKAVLHLGGLGTLQCLMSDSAEYGFLIPATTVSDYLYEAFRLLEQVLGCVGATMEEAMEENLKKLGQRYADGFSPEASMARVDESPQTNKSQPTIFGYPYKFVEGMTPVITVDWDGGELSTEKDNALLPTKEETG